MGREQTNIFVYKMIISATEGKGIGNAGVGAALLLE